MSRWFRHYAGMMRDEKFVRAALKAKQPIERVVWVWGAILESAAEIDDNGRYELDEAEAAHFLRTKAGNIRSITLELEQLGRLSEGRVVKWGDRQFKSDRSADRVRAFREQKRTRAHIPPQEETLRNGDVTLQERFSNAPETETYTDPPKPPEGAGRPLDVLLDRLIAAAGGKVVHNSIGIEVVTPILDLQAMGCDLETDILPAISEWARGLPGPIKTWAARPLRDRALEKMSIRKQGRGSAAPAEEIPEWLWEKRVAQFLTEPDKWPRGLGPSPDNPACRCPAAILVKHGFRSAA